MKRVSLGIHALMLVTMLVMQSAGSWYCRAMDTVSPASVVGACASQQDCCGDHSQDEETPDCCVELASEPTIVPLATKVQPLEPTEAELPLWGIPGDENETSSVRPVHRFFAGVDPPPALSTLTVRLSVRLI